MTRLMTTVWQERGGKSGVVLVVLVLLLALIGPSLAADPNQIDVQARFAAPSLGHLLGTDNLGRDLFARVAVGTRSALIIACLVVALSMAGGTCLGVTAALSGRLVDRSILAMLDIISAFPIYILIFALVALYGTGMGKLIVVISLAFLPQFARVARNQALTLKYRPFIEAALLMGLSQPNIILRHIVPNIIGPMIVLASMNVPVVITIEAAMSFIGLGVQPPATSLGTLIRDGYVFLDQSWWPIVGSAAVLAVVTLGCTLLGEALRDAVDPKLRGRM
ncbi:ABC transporter permease [Cypionkella sp.]|uniref:ABC transporter permease n=1 Tax=Cypionkella sp. TaxID=2811411 RepID=UPI002ABAD128|nr:ABC transporter permease [Cypionkella sp.]MDZ4395247.1 ABC transporter permease [Cypionkella sp.]